ncbi:alpha/beta hydrolase [Nanoarchaeota archaeon]
MEILISNSQHQQLKAILDKASSEKIVILCHGFTSNKSRTTYTELAKLLTERGISVFRFDFMGHGESYGKIEDMTISQHVKDFQDVLAHVKSLGFTSIGVFGSSMGGLTALLGVARSEGIKCIALKAPAANWKPKLESTLDKSLDEWKESGFAYYTTGRHGNKTRLNYSLYEDLLTFDTFEEAKDIKCPVLVVVGDEDASVPVADCEKLSESIEDCEVIVIENEDHFLTNTAPETRAFMADWLQKNL